MKKRILASVLAAMMAAAMAGCGGGSSSAPAGSSAPADPSASAGDASQAPAESGAPAAEGDTIKIGGLAPLTGDVSQYGIAVNNAVLMAVEKLNANGGILGRQIEYICEDEKGDPNEAINAYNKLVSSDGVVAIVGDVTTKPTQAVAQKSVDDNLPMITASATGEDVTQAGTNMYRVCFIDPYQGKLMANYASQKLSAKTAAIIYDNGDPYSTGIADAFEAAAKELGMEVVAKEGYQTGSTDFNSQLAKVKAVAPDVLLLPVYYNDVALIADQARANGIESKLLGADGWDGVLGKIDPSKTDVLKDAYFCSQYSAESTDPDLQAFLAVYKEKYNTEANMFAVLGYDAMNILADSINRAGSVDSQAIIDAMKETNYKGLTGTTTFDENRNPVRSAVILTIEGGAYKFVENFEI